MKGITMDINTVLSLSPEEFAESWNNSNEIVDACRERLGLKYTTDEDFVL